MLTRRRSATVSNFALLLLSISSLFLSSSFLFLSSSFRISPLSSSTSRCFSLRFNCSLVCFNLSSLSSRPRITLVSTRWSSVVGRLPLIAASSSGHVGFLRSALTSSPSHTACLPSGGRASSGSLVGTLQFCIAINEFRTSRIGLTLPVYGIKHFFIHQELCVCVLSTWCHDNTAWEPSNGSGTTLGRYTILTNQKNRPDHLRECSDVTRALHMQCTL